MSPYYEHKRGPAGREAGRVGCCNIAIGWKKGQGKLVIPHGEVWLECDAWHTTPQGLGKRGRSMMSKGLLLLSLSRTESTTEVHRLHMISAALLSLSACQLLGPTGAA
jgi:hypothetical protein